MDNIKNHVIFVLSSRFPTEKAYGTTTEYSAQALSNLGFRVTLVTPKLGYTPNSKVNIQVIGGKLHKILLSNKIRNLTGIRFTIFEFIYAYLLTRRFTYGENVFWTRDILISLVLSLKPKYKILCEIHRKPVKFQNRILFSLLKMRPNITTAPISKPLQEKLGLSVKKSIVAPMSINESEREYFLKGNQKRGKVIIYLGSYISGTHKLNLNFLNDFSYALQAIDAEWRVEVIGIHSNFFKSECLNQLSSNLIIHEYLERTEIISKLAKARIGLVIYPNNSYFQDSFPIKIVEYAIAGLAIVASSTIAHHQILGDDKCLYFESESLSSLVDIVKKLIMEPDTRERIINKAFLWASELTYENRVKSVISHIYEPESKV